MRTAVKTFSIISVVIGSFAIMGGLIDMDGYALLGGVLFLAQGILTLVYIGQEKNKK